MKQLIKIKVFDVDNFKEGVDVAQKLIGEVDFYAHEILKAKNQQIKLKVVNDATKKESGAVIVQGEEKKRGSKLSYKMRFRLSGLEEYKKVFYRLYRSKDATNFIPIYESETSTLNESTKDYIFKVAELWAYALNRDDPDKKIQISLFQFKNNGQHVNIGNALFMADDISQKKKITINTKSNPNTFLEFLISETIEKYTFLDYVFSGLEISLIIGIDFTRSNGEPTNPNSKHYFDYCNSIY